MSMSDRSLFKPLKERKLFQWTLAYLAGAFLVFQAVEVLAEPWGISRDVQRVVHVILLLGVLVTLVLAWYHGEKGRQRVSGPELLMVAALLTIAGVAVSLLRSTDPGIASGAHDPGRELADGRPSVAVLPWANRSGREEDLWFSDGVHDEILNRVSGIGGLRVISRQSVMQFRDSPLGMGDIARTLGVQYVLEGGLLRAGDNVRIHVQLIDAKADDHLWTGTYDRLLSIENLLEVQSDIATRIATELQAAVTPAEEARISAPQTGSLKAYEHYMRGRHFSREHTQRGLRRGLEHFQSAIDLDPTFASAYVGLAYCHRELDRLGYAGEGEGYSPAKDALSRAIELDENLGEAHAALAFMRFVSEWEMSGPEYDFRRAVQLSPNCADVHSSYAQYLMWTGRGDESIDAARRAVALDPITPLTLGWLGAAYFYAGRYTDAVRQYERVLELAPGFVWAHIYLAHCYAMLGLHDQALAHADSVVRISRASGDASLPAYVGGDYAISGRPGVAREILEQSVDLFRQGSLDPTTVALIHASLGETDQAFVWLEEAVEQRSGLAVYLRVYGNTFLAHLSRQPRYRELLSRIGLTNPAGSARHNR